MSLLGVYVYVCVCKLATRAEFHEYGWCAAKSEEKSAESESRHIITRQLKSNINYVHCCYSSTTHTLNIDFKNILPLQIKVSVNTVGIV